MIPMTEDADKVMAKIHRSYPGMNPRNIKPVLNMTHHNSPSLIYSSSLLRRIVHFHRMLHIPLLVQAGPLKMFANSVLPINQICVCAASM